MGLRSIGLDFGEKIEITIMTDATAAQDTIYRQGLAKLHHVEVDKLWLQGKVKEGQITVLKVPRL